MTDTDTTYMRRWDLQCLARLVGVYLGSFLILASVLDFLSCKHCLIWSGLIRFWKRLTKVFGCQSKSHNHQHQRHYPRAPCSVPVGFGFVNGGVEDGAKKETHGEAA